MLTLHELLNQLYQIQGKSDPAHPETVESLKERMAEIYEIACDAMNQSGFQPED
jgi:hypothetical protein